MDAFRRFFRSFSEGAATATEYRAVFEEVFARDFESSWIAFIDAKSCAYDDWYCADVEPVTLPAQVGPLDCSDGRTLGYEHVPAEGEASFRPLRVVHVVTPDPSQIQIQMEYATVYLGKCGDCETQEPALLLTSYDEPGVPPASVDLDLGAGTYALIVRASPGGDTRVSIR